MGLFFEKIGMIIELDTDIWTACIVFKNKAPKTFSIAHRTNSYWDEKWQTGVRQDVLKAYEEGGLYKIFFVGDPFEVHSICPIKS